jgi:hypothetical protein
VKAGSWWVRRAASAATSSISCVAGSTRPPPAISVRPRVSCHLPFASPSRGHRFSSLADFIAFGTTRYRDLRKQCDSFEACEAAGGFAVFVRGEMSGSWLDGTPFSRVRWCDRFLVQSGRIVDLETWSDLAETRQQL